MNRRVNFPIVAGFLLIAFAFVATTTSAQHVSHHKNTVSTTASYHNYIYPISASQGYDIKYFIVEASNGDIKVAFDACDVCWGQYKGYSQNGNLMICNNCGNSYNISDLGSQGTGGCWPTYLPHTESTDSVIILISDLGTKKTHFKLVPLQATSIDRSELPEDYKFAMTADQISLLMPNSDTRNISLLSIDGKRIQSVKNNTGIYSKTTNELSKGVYILVVEESDKNYAVKFAIQ